MRMRDGSVTRAGFSGVDDLSASRRTTQGRWRCSRNSKLAAAHSRSSEWASLPGTTRPSRARLQEGVPRLIGRKPMPSAMLAVTSAAVTDCESCLRQREVTACRCADPATDR